MVGLIGRNGAGKSSLLKSVAGAVALDDGRVNIKGDVSVAYVPQEPELDPEHSVFEAVAEGLGELKSLLTEYHQVTHQLTQADADHEQALARMEHIQHELEARGGWQFDALISSTLSHLDLNPDARIGELSGGWKTRGAGARAGVRRTCCCWTNPPTTWTCPPSNGWKACSRISAAACS